MSEFVIGGAPPPYGESVAPRNRPRGRASARGRAERALGVLLGTVAAALVVASAFVFVPPLLRVSRYDISGATSLSEAEILEAALLHGSEYFFALDPARVRAALLASPRIAVARVERRFPNALSIAIAERIPVAAVLVERSGRLEPVLIDAEGVAFAYAADYEAGVKARTAAPARDEGGRDGHEDLQAAQTALARLAQLPIVSGLRFEGSVLGTRLPPSLAPFLTALARLEAAEPALLAVFSEIRIVKPAYGEPELLLYPLHHRIPVRTSAALNEETLRSIILVLDVLASRGLAEGVGEIDFRRGTIVYRGKGGQSG